MLYLICVILVLVLRPSDLSPLPKVIHSIKEVDQNKIVFPQSGHFVFDDTQNEVEFLPRFGLRKFDPKLNLPTKATTKAPAQEGTSSVVYLDKIMFAQDVATTRNRYGYTRKFSNFQQKSEPVVVLRSANDEPLPTVGIQNEDSSTSKPQKGSTSFQTNAWIIPSTENLNSRYDNGQGQPLPRIIFETSAASNPNTSDMGDNRPKQQNATTRVQDQITFHSLFRTPSFDKSPGAAPCPENMRRDHHGNCRRPVRRIRYKIIAEEV